MASICPTGGGGGSFKGKLLKLKFKSSILFCIVHCRSRGAVTREVSATDWLYVKVRTAACCCYYSYSYYYYYYHYYCYSCY